MSYLSIVCGYGGRVSIGEIFVVTASQSSTVVTPAQVRMARAALRWSLDQLAIAAGVHRNTISNFETGKFAGDASTLRKLRGAIEKAGIEFIDGDAPGLRLRHKPKSC